MKININSTLESQEVIDSYFRPKLEEKGIKDGNYTIEVQKSNGDWVVVSPEKVKFLFVKE